jgi:membrane dipeptidase
MDGLTGARLTEEYVTDTLPKAGIDAIHTTISDENPINPSMDFETATTRIAQLQERIDRWPGVSQARSATDLTDDGVSFVFGFQDSTPIERSLENIRIFDQLGVRIVQLTYNSRNWSGNGCTEKVDGGISKLGLQLVDALDAHNILLDLSHVGPQTALDALEVASQPVIFSHSNPIELYDHPRNITDEHIEKAAATGGVIGANAFPIVVADDPTIEDVVDHIEYLSELVGPEHVSIGLDFADNKPMEQFDDLYSDDPEIPSPPWEYPDGLASAPDVPNLTRRLLERGFSENEIRGIIGENLLRVCTAVWDD